MSKLVLDAQPRTMETKARHLRLEGKVPAILYGPGNKPIPVVMEEKGLDQTLRQASTTLLQVTVDGTKHNVMVREVQRHPVNHRPLHVDFYLVRMDQKQQVAVQLVPVGKPESLVSGLMVLQNQETILIEALPADIPPFIEVDVAHMTTDQPITVAQLPAVAGVAYLTEADVQLISLVEAQAGIEEEEAAVEEEESAEPEVVKKGKEDEEEE